MSKLIARLGDGSSHVGSIISGTASTVLTEGSETAKDGCLHSCPIQGHGITPVMSTSKNYVEGSKIVRNGDVAGCGAVIISGAINTFSN